MPNQIIDTMRRRLGMSEKRAETLWKESKDEAKQSAEESGKKYGWGLVVHILKNKLTPKQLKKLGWKKRRKRKKGKQN